MLWPGSSGFTVRRARICVAGLHRQRIFAREREALGPADGDRDQPRPDAGGRDRAGVTAPRFLASSVSGLVAALDAQRSVGGDGDLIVAGGALDIVEVEPERATCRRSAGSAAGWP